MTRPPGAPVPGILSFLLSAPLGGCSAAGAPSFRFFGAFFPAWMICASVGIVAALAARAIAGAGGFGSALPYPLFVFTALGVIAGLLAWLLWFGR